MKELALLCLPFLLAFFAFIILPWMRDIRTKRIEENRRYLLKSEIPWRYLCDTKDIVAKWIRYKENGLLLPDSGPYSYDDDVIRIEISVLRRFSVEGEYCRSRVWLHNYPSSGEDELILSISDDDFRDDAPEIYRPQGSQKWEDHLIYLSEHIGEIIAQEKRKARDRKQEVWELNHSPLP